MNSELFIFFSVTFFAIGLILLRIWFLHEQVHILYKLKTFLVILLGVIFAIKAI